MMKNKNHEADLACRGKSNSFLHLPRLIGCNLNAKKETFSKQGNVSFLLLDACVYRTPAWAASAFWQAARQPGKKISPASTLTAVSTLR